jgi:hypothetical protein
LYQGRTVEVYISRSNQQLDSFCCKFINKYWHKSSERSGESTCFWMLSKYGFIYTKYLSNGYLGRAIVRAVSRWLPTAAPRVRARIWSSGICGEQSGAGAVFFSEYFDFPCQFSFHQILILTITRGRYNRREVADVPSGPSLDSTPHYANFF